MTLEVFDGASWNVLQTYSINSNITTAQFQSFDISSHIASDTQIRFRVTDHGLLSGNVFYLDDVQIQYTTNDAPIITNLTGNSLAYTEGDGAVVIEQGSNATVIDSDSTDFDTVSFAAGGDAAEDVLGIRNQGTGAGQIGVSGSNVTYSGTTIGTFTGGSGGTNLIITFNSNATPTAAGALLQNITYENTDTDNPTIGARTVRYVLTDGDGGSSGNHDATVTVSGQNDAPSLATNTGVTVNEGASGTVITTAMLNEGDPDDAGVGLTYTVTTVASNGTLRLSGSALAVNDTFTQADIDAGLLTYDHDGGETSSDSFTFDLADGGEDGASPLTGQMFSITVNAVNDAPSIAGTLAAQTVDDSATIAPFSGVTIGDVDNPAQIHAVGSERNACGNYTGNR